MDQKKEARLAWCPDLGVLPKLSPILLLSGPSQYFVTCLGWCILLAFFSSIHLEFHYLTLAVITLSPSVSFVFMHESQGPLPLFIFIHLCFTCSLFRHQPLDGSWKRTMVSIRACLLQQHEREGKNSLMGRILAESK